MLPAQPNQSLMDGITVLEAVLAVEEPISGRELARQLGLNRTRVNRLLMTLAHLGMLIREERGNYSPGPGIHTLAALGTRRSSLIRAARPIARKWWSEGYAVTLGMLWNDYLCYVLHARPEWPFENIIGGHSITHPLESSACLVLATHLEEGQLQRLATSSDRWSEAEAFDQIAKCRQNGFAELHFPNGECSIGLTIGTSPLAALSVSRVALELDKVLGPLREDVETLWST